MDVLIGAVVSGSIAKPPTATAPGIRWRPSRTPNGLLLVCAALVPSARASRVAASQQNRFRSTSPVMPGTKFLDEYCQIA